MDKQLKEALMKVINERAEQLGQKVESTDVEPLLASLGDRLSSLMQTRKQVGAASASCGSFQCPSSYSCDWF